MTRCAAMRMSHESRDPRPQRKLAMDRFLTATSSPISARWSAHKSVARFSKRGPTRSHVFDATSDTDVWFLRR